MRSRSLSVETLVPQYQMERIISMGLFYSKKASIFIGSRESQRCGGFLILDHTQNQHRIHRWRDAHRMSRHKYSWNISTSKVGNECDRAGDKEVEEIPPHSLAFRHN
jgi:hypothetical protein